MFTTIDAFLQAWKDHSDGTRRILSALTDQSLSQKVGPDDRTLGRMAWHIATAIPEMCERTGLKLDGPRPDAPLAKTAKEILNGYDILANSLAEQAKKNWNDSTLQIVDDMYGFKWARGLTLRILIDHEIHHRGQMTVLMRQAGLKVPGVFGPSREEWTNSGMPVPEI
jgi:uncharacterized damage-inducible protein DinB